MKLWTRFVRPRVRWPVAPGRMAGTGAAVDDAAIASRVPVAAPVCPVGLLAAQPLPPETAGDPAPEPPREPAAEPSATPAPDPAHEEPPWRSSWLTSTLELRSGLLVLEHQGWAPASGVEGADCCLAWPAPLPVWQGGGAEGR